MNKKILTLMFGMIFLFMTMSFVSSESIGTFKQNENVELYQTCNDCDYVNFTSIKYPNGTAFLKNIETTQEGTYYYYVLDSNYTNNLGTYTYCYEGANSYDSSTGCLEFEITETGNVFSDANTKTFGYSLLVMLFFSSLFFIISTTFKDKDNSEVNKKNRGARFFFIALSLVTAIIAVLYIMTTMQTVMPEFSALISGFSTFHYVILSVLFVLFIFIMINITFKLLEDMKAKSGRVPGRFNPYRQGRRMNPGRGFG